MCGHPCEIDQTCQLLLFFETFKPAYSLAGGFVDTSFVMFASSNTVIADFSQFFPYAYLECASSYCNSFNC